MCGFNRVCLCLLLMTFLLALGGLQTAVAQDVERDVSIHATYPHVVVPVGKKDKAVEFSVRVANEGDVSETVKLSVVSAPEGWDYQFKTGYPKQIVRAVSLTPRELDEENSSKELTFKVTPPDEVEVGDYEFRVKATTEDEAITSSLTVTVTVSEEEVAAAKAKGVELSTESATLEQSAGKSFEFSVDLKNQTKKSHRFSFNLKPSNPEIPLRGWTAYITKGYEETQIRDLQVDAEGSETIKVHLSPPGGVEVKEYPVEFEASSGDISDTIKLTAVITGTYELALTTPSEQPRVSTKATAGKTTHVSLLLENKGSSVLKDLSFSSSMVPEGWDVSFDPETISAFDAGATREIDVAIKPGAKTIAGDYMIELKASSSQRDDSVDYRVTVETPTTWGWVGVAIVVIVIAALIGIFVRVRRR